MTEPNLSMNGKTAVITGATAGIGLHSLIALGRAGAAVIGVGRDPARCRQAEAFVRAEVPGAQVVFLTAELSLVGEVRRLAKEIQSTLGEMGTSSLDVLINNAGGYSTHFIRTAEGLERTLAVNHLAPFVLSLDLLPLLQAARQGRIITVSSNSHYRTWMNLKRLNNPLFFNGLWYYKLTKLANVLFTLEFNRRHAGGTVKAFALDPGLVNTAIGQKGTDGIVNWIWSQRRKKGQPPEVPARTALLLSAEPSLQSATEYYWRDLKPKAPSRASQNPKLAAGLWDLSIELTRNIR